MTRKSTPRVMTMEAFVAPSRGVSRLRIGSRQIARTTAQPISRAKGWTTFHIIQAMRRTA
ncbi:MAG: hypothetical protein U0599_13035 [Vicinamibacteria bacterium]